MINKPTRTRFPLIGRWTREKSIQSGVSPGWRWREFALGIERSMSVGRSNKGYGWRIGVRRVLCELICDAKAYTVCWRRDWSGSIITSKLIPFTTFSGEGTHGSTRRAGVASTSIPSSSPSFSPISVMVEAEGHCWSGAPVGRGFSFPSIS